MPGAFDKTLREDDIRALWSHDTSKVLGRKSAGTLRLSVDAKGLRYEIDPPDTQIGRDAITSIRRGDVTGSSFGFVPRATVEKKEGNQYIDEQHDLQLMEVSPVAFPAYSATSVGVRGIGNSGTHTLDLAELNQLEDFLAIHDLLYAIDSQD